MTGQLRSTDPAAPPALLRPLAPAKNRAEEIVERVSAEIAAGRLRPGAQLPTEQAMMAAMGVSRTVVREAVSALKARGLVVTRQGAGAFVRRDGPAAPYTIDPDGLGSFDRVLDVLELRLAVEVEAAALAADRADADARALIRGAHAVFVAAVAQGAPAIVEDHAFHHAIAAATGNAEFAAFHDFLGRVGIPRRSIRTHDGDPEGQGAYLRLIEQEHAAILAAIEAGEAPAAREAMRSHLANSAARYRALAGSGAA